MIRKCKKNYKLGIAFILGILVSTVGVYAITKLSSSDVLYDNSKSGGSSSDVQGAIEELYEKSNKCTTGSCSLTRTNFFVGYTYNEDKNAANYCVTGDEVTCERTDCYTSSSKTCPSGTIIDYIVSGDKNNKVRFHVMYDGGKKLTMQSQKNIVGSTTWYATLDNTKGPLTSLAALESITASWSNVEDQNYTMGTTNFTGKTNGEYTSCSGGELKTCLKNQYVLSTRIAKTRMITQQETHDMGCNGDKWSCPSWMGGSAYWTMQAYSANTVLASSIENACITIVYLNSSRGARAVVVVSK